MSLDEVSAMHTTPENEFAALMDASSLRAPHVRALREPVPEGVRCQLYAAAQSPGACDRQLPAAAARTQERRPAHHQEDSRPAPRAAVDQRMTSSPLPDVPAVRSLGIPRLTSGFDLAEWLDLRTHLKVHGRMEPMAGVQLVALAEGIGLTDRGGAGLSFGTKMRSVAEDAMRRGVRPALVVAGQESDPACRHNTTLMNRAPHLVLDGVLQVAEALGVRTLVVIVSGAPTEASLRAALDERGLPSKPGRVKYPRVQIHRSLETRSGAHSGLMHPTDWATCLAATGIDGLPTLVAGAETYAQLATAVRFGAQKRGAPGLPNEPGTVMLTLSGAVQRPMVVECPTGAPLRQVLQLAGAPPTVQGILTGGYRGGWIHPSDSYRARISEESVKQHGGSLGAGAILPLGQETCPLGEVLRVARWAAAARLADERSPRLASASGPLAHLLEGGGPDALQELREAVSLPERDSSTAPDGAARFIDSALTVFADDLSAHLHGGCGRETARVPAMPYNDEREEALSRERLAADWAMPTSG